MRHDTDSNGTPLSLRDEQKRLTRRRLIEGALAAFEQKGYAATTIDDIVAQANASRATFYLHFKSKADVVLVMTETLGRRWRELYLELTSGGRLSRKALYEWLDGDRRELPRPTARAWTPSTMRSRSSPWWPKSTWPTARRALRVMAESIERWYGGDGTTPASAPRCSSHRWIASSICGSSAASRSTGSAQSAR